MYMIPFTGGREHSQPGGGGAGAKQGLLRPRGRRLEGRAGMLQANKCTAFCSLFFRAPYISTRAGEDH